MEDAQSVATLIDSTTTKIQQLQQAFAELENHRAVSLNLKWKELEAHFHGLERSLKRRFDDLGDQEKEFKNKAAEARELLEKKKAAVKAKEHASLEKLQQKRDAALFFIGDAFKKYKTSSVKPVVVKVEDSCESDLTVEEKPPDMKVAAVDPDEVNKISDNETMDVKPRPELAKLCEEMDSKGLHKYISDNRKNLATIREEIPFALMISADPARLVLDSLEDFYRIEAPTSDGKRDSGLLGLRRTCIMLMECLAQSLADTGRVCFSDVINHDIKEHAKAIAEEWKPKLDDLDVDASSGNSLEAHAFLQLLATFDIAGDFDEEEILKLIPTVSRRRQTADLCRLLGLSHKMPGVIEVLVNTGRQIDAVNLAYAFELTEQFSPVVLLKSHLKEARKASSPTKPGNASPTAENEVNDRELTSLKAVVKCIEEHKLEGQYPVDPLQKRISQLEKAKADKKRVAEAAKPQPKRPRANGGGFAPRVSNINDKSFYATVPDRYPPYNYENMHYVYPGHTNNHPTPVLGAAAYNIPPNHGSYFGNGYAYQAPYLH
ncbi:FRIGIDA-like protein 3 [Papaver somniferum]|uniref:FRIGIDA-like protein 3 n=1 Tax=Papaver somniferum TaxID=3469 RepID=UPI000E6FAEEB|nr:FRIGIDA-like protein 3 [Papaver somniferum]